MSTEAMRRCPGCGNPVIRTTMRAYLQVWYCVECFVRRTSQERTARARGISARPALPARRNPMPVKYGTADHVEVQGDRAVISPKPLPKGEAQKLAAAQPGRSRKNAVVTTADHRVSDEDDVPGA